MRKQLEMMNRMDENREQVAKAEAYSIAIRPIMMNEEQFMQMSPKAQEEILNLLGQINRYWKQ